MADLRIPLREYLDEKFSEQRDWMSATFATKDDVAAIATRVTVVETGAKNSGAKWGALVSAAVSGVVLGIAALFGYRSQ